MRPPLPERTSCAISSAPAGGQRIRYGWPPTPASGDGAFTFERSLDPVQHAGDDAAGHDAVAEHRDQYGKQGRRGEDRDGDDCHRAERHRAQGLVVDHPETGQRDDHGEAREGHGEARGRKRLGAGVVGSATRTALLAVAGEDEERVVDRHPDPDHRGHVGDEDRGRHLQRDEVDQRPGDDHADEAEGEGQGRRGERSEDDEQDQGDDREAPGLGLGQVLLGELLHPGPDRRLAGEVRGDPIPGGARVEPGAQVRGRVDQFVAALAAAQRHERGSGPLQLGAGPSRVGSRQGHSFDFGDRGADPVDRRGAIRPTRRPVGSQDDPDRLGASAEFVFDRSIDGRRLAAGDVEAAAREVIGLMRGDRQSDDEDHHPGGQHPAPTTS